MSTVITGHTDHAGAVLGVHGGDGVMYWLRAATGSHLYSEWDGIEWVAFDPGGRAGLHTHTHTEEIWFFLRGTAEIELDGERHHVSPGSIVLTPLHSSHAIWNTGDERLEYVVIEVFPPEVSQKLPPRRPTEEDDTNTGASRGDAGKDA
jgi:mannose-6-phosphate isomerase-like protein (cupin superfamily)